MTDKIGHIKNPLTIIAIFAGLAEVGGTIVLPLLEHDIQFVYVWFLMFFPALLVGIFFWVLYKKHQVLYAPSDFRDDSGFMEFARRGYLTNQAVEKLAEESKNVTGDSDAAAAPNPQALPDAEPEFTALPTQTRKILKTLWRYQQNTFPDEPHKRWGFGVRIGSPDYREYSKGLLPSLKYGFTAVDPRGLCFLSDKGYSYCQKYDKEIGTETELYNSFSN